MSVHKGGQVALTVVNTDKKGDDDHRVSQSFEQRTELAKQMDGRKTGELAQGHLLQTASALVIQVSTESILALHANHKDQRYATGNCNTNKTTSLNIMDFHRNKQLLLTEEDGVGNEEST